MGNARAARWMSCAYLLELLWRGISGGVHTVHAHMASVGLMPLLWQKSGNNAINA